MPDGIDDTPEELDIYDLERLDALVKGRKGFQNEAGFKIHELVGFAVVPVISCSSDAHPTAQDRFVSPFELDQTKPELEVADRMYCVRIHGRVVVGRRDDLAEVAVQQGRSHLVKLTAPKIGRVLSFLGKLASKLTGLFG